MNTSALNPFAQTLWLRNNAIARVGVFELGVCRYTLSELSRPRVNLDSRYESTLPAA